MRFSAVRVFENPVIIGYPNRGEDLTQTELINNLNNLPEGSRAGVFFLRQNSNKGHALICEKINGKLLFNDPQRNINNAIRSLEKAVPNGFGYFRMDNLTIREDYNIGLIAEAVASKKENRYYLNERTEISKMDENLAIEILKNNWWKRYKTKNHETYEVHIKGTVGIDEYGAQFIVAIIKKGVEPSKYDFRVWQVNKNGDCGVVIDD